MIRLVAMTAIALSCICATGLGQEIEAQVSEADAIVIPERESLPLGMPSTMVEGEDSHEAGYLPDVMEFVRVGGALVVVVGLLLGIRTVLRRINGMPSARRPSGVVQVHARYPVARGQQIVVLQVGQRFIVAHQGANGMRTLSEITEPGEVASLRDLLDPKGSPGGRTGNVFQQKPVETSGGTAGEVIDLTRSNRRSKKRMSRVPDWGGAA